jgi:hypothetical protein
MVRMLGFALAMMIGGWLLSAGTTLYDVPAGDADPLPMQAWAADPVIPSAERSRGHNFSWPEAPFASPPPESLREENFWMMSQRAATLSYHVFAAGFSLAVYALFRVACDFGGMQLTLFRVLGANALAAYIAHGLVDKAVSPFVPHDAPAWYVAAGFVLYFAITYWLIHWLDLRQIFIRL